MEDKRRLMVVKARNQMILCNSDASKNRGLALTQGDCQDVGADGRGWLVPRLVGVAGVA